MDLGIQGRKAAVAAASPGTPATTSIDGYREAIDLNLLSTIVMCQAALPGMRERGWGRIVAITSIGACTATSPLAPLHLWRHLKLPTSFG